MEFVEGDTDCAIRPTLRRKNGLPFDLRGLIAIIKLRVNDNASIEKTMVQLDSENGVCQYTFLATELVRGKLTVEFEVRS